MSKQLNREEAWALLTEYNQDPFHLHHARTVEGCAPPTAASSCSPLPPTPRCTALLWPLAAFWAG